MVVHRMLQQRLDFLLPTQVVAEHKLADIGNRPRERERDQRHPKALGFFGSGFGSAAREWPDDGGNLFLLHEFLNHLARVIRIELGVAEHQLPRERSIVCWRNLGERSQSTRPLKFLKIQQLRLRHAHTRQPFLLFGNQGEAQPVNRLADQLHHPAIRGAEWKDHPNAVRTRPGGGLHPNLQTLQPTHLFGIFVLTGGCEKLAEQF